MDLVMRIQIAQLPMRRSDENVATRFCQAAAIYGDIRDSCGSDLNDVSMRADIPPTSRLRVGGRQVGQRGAGRQEQPRCNAIALQECPDHETDCGYAECV